MSNHTNSSSTSINYVPHPKAVWYWSLRGVIAIVAVLGNGMVVLLIVSKRKLWTKTNCFILSLSLADFGTGVVNTPLEFGCTVLLSSCDWWLVQAIKDVFLVSSIFNLCAMTIDRYVAVVHPLHHAHIMSQKTCILIIALAWFLGTAIPWSFFAVIRCDAVHTYRIISIFRLLLTNTLPMTGLVLAYLRMLSLSRRHRRRVGQQRRDIDYNYSRGRRASAETYAHARPDNGSALQFIGSMILFFVFCYSLTFYRVLSSYILLINVPAIIVPISRLLYYMNSALNFVVYALFKKDIKTEAMRLYCRTISNSAADR